MVNILQTRLVNNNKKHNYLLIIKWENTYTINRFNYDRKTD